MEESYKVFLCNLYKIYGKYLQKSNIFMCWVIIVGISLTSLSCLFQVVQQTTGQSRFSYKQKQASILPNKLQTPGRMSVEWRDDYN